jgi:predicted N-acetyltransferase YhbS
MRIDYLADHPEMAPLLAAWHYQEWAELLPEWSLAEALADLNGHVGRRQIPTTFVAVEDGRPVGSASLLESDLDGWDHLTPWVASVFVIPQRRGRGVGRRLMARVVEEAKALGVSIVYLFTAGQAAYYQRLGWEPWQVTEHEGREVVIMRRLTDLGGPVES